MSCTKGKHVKWTATRFGLMCDACRHTLVCADEHEFAMSPLPDTITCIHCGYEIDLNYPAHTGLRDSDGAADREAEKALHRLRKYVKS